jgi:hypothetical protein
MEERIPRTPITKTTKIKKTTRRNSLLSGENKRGA